MRYGKDGKIRFVSAIDMGRIWERSLRKADLPIAYSEGFSPHPKISFPDALPLGFGSTGEYAELTFAVPIDIDAAMTELNGAFPSGLRILDAVVVRDGDPKLAKGLSASLWDVVYPPGTDMRGAVAIAVAAETLVVERQRKGEPVPVDLRPAIALLTAQGPHVRVLLHHVEPAVRPTELDLAFRLFDQSLPAPVLISRVAQGLPAPDGVIEALSGTLIPCTPPSS